MRLRSQDRIQKKFNKFLRRTLQLVLSVSLFSLFVWYSSGFSILPQSFNAYFSTCLFSMLTRTLERKYMFLIFNGILAFLAKTSLSTSSPPISAFDTNDFQASNLPETKDPVTPEISVPLMVEQVEEQQEYYEQASGLAEEEEEDCTLLGENEGGSAKDVVEVGGTRTGVRVTQDDELAVATTEELANTDELNRRFEEFIRKMKEEIRIEAQTHPIAV